MENIVDDSVKKFKALKMTKKILMRKRIDAHISIKYLQK